MKRLFTLAALGLVLFSLRAACAEVFFENPPRDNWYQSPLLRITAFAFGASDCMLLECGGESMMVDGGTADYGRELEAELHKRGIRHLKYLFNTHYHEDHVGGLCELMAAGFTTDAYLHPYVYASIYANPNHRRAMSLVKSKGIFDRQVNHGETLYLGEAELHVLRYDEGTTANARSAVLHVRFGSASALLTADIIGETQTWFVKNADPSLLDADILKAPHHGVTAVTADFWNAVSPQMMFITGPEKEARDAIRQSDKNGVPFLTNENGHIVMETDGTDWYIPGAVPLDPGLRAAGAQGW